MGHTKNLVEAIRRKLARDHDLAQAVENERLSINVSQEIYRLREEAGLTQLELANKVGTQQSVIARLEDADYDGHSLRLLRRIAESMGKRVEVRFVEPFSSAGFIAPEEMVGKKSYWYESDLEWGVEAETITTPEPNLASPAME